MLPPFTLSSRYYALGPRGSVAAVPRCAAERLAHSAYFEDVRPVRRAPGAWQPVPGVLFIAGVVLVRDAVTGAQFVTHLGTMVHALDARLDGADVTVSAAHFGALALRLTVDVAAARRPLARWQFPPSATPYLAAFLLRSLGPLPVQLSAAWGERTTRTGDEAVLLALRLGEHGGLWDLEAGLLLPAGLPLRRLAEASEAERRRARAVGELTDGVGGARTEHA